MVLPFTRVTRNTITITITISLHTHTHTHTLRAASWCWASLSWINYSGGIKKAHTNTLNHSDSHTHSHHVWLEERIGNAWKEDKDWNGAFLSKLLHVIYCSNYSQTSVRLFIWNDCKNTSRVAERPEAVSLRSAAEQTSLTWHKSRPPYRLRGWGLFILLYLTQHTVETMICYEHWLWHDIILYDHIIYNLLSLICIRFFIYDSSLW